MKKCCIIGHRNFVNNSVLELKIKDLIVYLIECEKVTEFLFGSKSSFNDFCYEIVSNLMDKYPYVKRIYVRAEYPIISNDYYNYLKTIYEESYFFDKKLQTNKFSHIRRNKYIIDKSDICLFYYDKRYIPDTKTRSGTRIAYEYAVTKGKIIYNVLN